MCGLQKNTNTQGPSSASNTWVIIMTLAGLLVCYVLSPIILVASAHHLNRDSILIDTLVILVTPLQFLYDNVPFVTAFYDWLFKPFINP
ncbi:MAG: hypothetical protein ACFCU3_06175 [Verrucomicrobiales bacterium]